MKKKSFGIVFTLILGLTLTGVFDKSFLNFKSDHEIRTANNERVNDKALNINNKVSEEKLDNELQNEVVPLANDVTITMRDIADFLTEKKEHYPLSDEFIERYQQASGGYIDLAKKKGLLVDRTQHEPNQKWHFFDSWLQPSIEDGSLSWDEDAKSRVYTKLLCPELLLWIYEASGVDPIKVKNAKVAAESGRVANTSVSTIAKNMRACVPWEDIKKTILEAKLDYPNANKHKVTVNNNEGFSVIGLQSEYKEGAVVTFTINVLDTTKVIKEVKANGEILSPISGSTYKFLMPNNDVDIVITLKDFERVAATSVSLSSTTLDLVLKGQDKELSAVVLPSNTTDMPSWSILEGEDNINITPNANKVMVHALKVGTAKIKVSYNESVSAECLVNVQEPLPSKYLAKYNIEYDLGTRTTSKAIATTDELFQTFKLNDGEDIISSVSQMEYMYGGAYGGTGETKWYTGDILKFGTTSVNGSMTLELKKEVRSVIITGYVNASTCKIQVGDKLVTCSEMNVTTKEIVDGKQTSTIEIAFTSTNSLTIATTNKKPFYITSIEFNS